MKKAVISMDYEDWYHLDYFREYSQDTAQSLLLEGAKEFLDIITKEDIKATFFVVGELISKDLDLLKDLLSRGHEIAGHSYHHTRPLLQSLEDFSADSERLRNELRSNLNIINPGYRAPCFSLDDDRLDIIERLNYAYDSSRICAGFHPLYGTLRLPGFRKIIDNVYCRGNFMEFELSTEKVSNMRLPISGGGYLRLLPWFVF